MPYEYDLIIVGAGPAGIFTALELLRKSAGPKAPRILLIEKGKPVERRHCPKDKTGRCVNCKPTCAITTGFSGAGAFSDGKLSLSREVGGELPELIGEDFAQDLIDYTDKIYLEFGADPHVEGVYEGPEIKDIRKRAIQAGLQLVDCPIRHLGTEKAQQLYLPELIGEDFAQDLIDYTDKIYLEFGADPHVEGVYEGPEIKDIRKRAIQAGLQLVDCPIRHLGTEKAQQLYLNIQNHLAEKGVEMWFETECENILLDGDVCRGVVARPTGAKTGEAERRVTARQVVIATGRRGAEWLEKICAEHHIAHRPGTVDIGVRVECRNEIMETINSVLYEGKLIGYPNPWKNKVRTFCQNPGGFVAQENYDNDLAVVNGHSYKDIKSQNTNLAILVSHNFTEPFNQPIAYAQKIGELTNMLGAGHILVQRYGDILNGKRTWPQELARANVRPTLKDAIAGDITAAMPYRAMVNIIEFIKMVDQVVPGFAAPETLLYSPELKFYSNKVRMDQNLETNIRNLHCLGDSSGWTRGLMMASVMGVLMGRKLIENHGF